MRIPCCGHHACTLPNVAAAIQRAHAEHAHNLGPCQRVPAASHACTSAGSECPPPVALMPGRVSGNAIATGSGLLGVPRGVRATHSGTYLRAAAVRRHHPDANSDALLRRARYEVSYCVCVFKAPRTYTPVLGALVSPLARDTVAACKYM